MEAQSIVTAQRGTNRPTVVCCAACSPPDATTLPAIVQALPDAVPACWSCGKEYRLDRWVASYSARPGFVVMVPDDLLGGVR